jgi:eukaryotic-like serine/threonine-protein kinase
VPEVIADRYELGRELGSGGMARVVAARDRLLDREVAVKLLTVPPDPAARERFLREARAAARLRHPRVVGVHDTGEHAGQPFLVMELVEGETLGELLAREGPREPEEAVALTLGVLEALAHAHREGLIHRDIKPDNVLLPREGGVKLADFGIAKAMDEATAGLTATGAVMGTAAYLAPELVEGAAPSPASDVYSVGCLLYALLAGRPPFTGESALAIAYAQRHTPVPPIADQRPDVPTDLQAVLAGALEKHPGERYPDAEAMRAALLGEGTSVPAATVPLAAPIPGAAIAQDRTAVLGGDGSATVRDGSATVRDGRRSTLTALAGVLAVAVVLAVAGWWLATRLGGPDELAAEDDPAGEIAAPGPGADEEAAGGDAGEVDGNGVEDEDVGADGEGAEAEDGAEEAATPEPRTLDELIAVLAAAPPEAYGEKHDDLLDDLVELSQEEDAEDRLEDAGALQEEVRTWVEEGELDAEMGRIAIAVLEGLAAG